MATKALMVAFLALQVVFLVLASSEVSPDRSVREVSPDRSVREVSPDRSVREVSPDRSVRKVSPDRSVREVSADRSVREPRHVHIQAGGPLCSSAGYRDGCCVIGPGTTCRVNNFCYCDISCYLFEDCCSDIRSIGCLTPNQSTCSELTLANGSIDFKPFMIDNPRRVGATATHSCNENYTLVGNTDRVCMYDVRWSGSPPTCELLCPVLDIENGQVQYNSSQSISPPRTVRTVALAKCNPGYAFVGNEVRICQSNGQWSGDNAACVECPPLELENGEIDLRIDLMSNLEPMHTVAVARCHYGFNLSGDERRICRHSNDGNSAQWSGHSAQCVAASCTAAGYTGCCTQNCYVGTIDICFCGVQCYKHSSLRCCPDIELAGCFPRTCAEANLSPGCCDWSVNANCYVPGGNGCNCDPDCRRYNDCCSDVPTNISCPTAPAVSRQELIDAMRQGYRRRPAFLYRNRAGQSRARDMTEYDRAAIERAQEFESMTRAQGQRSRGGSMRQNDDIEKLLHNAMHEEYRDGPN